MLSTTPEAWAVLTAADGWIPAEAGMANDTRYGARGQPVREGVGQGWWLRTYPDPGSGQEGLRRIPAHHDKPVRLPVFSGPLIRSWDTL